MEITAFSHAQRYIGIREFSGPKAHPLISWWLSLCAQGDTPSDEVAWCSAFVNGMAWDLRLPRSKNAAARSWLGVGAPIPLSEAKLGFDIVVLTRGGPNEPGPEVLAAPGHVGFFAGLESPEKLWVLGGNQGDAVSVAPFPIERVLGVRGLS